MFKKKGSMGKREKSRAGLGAICDNATMGKCVRADVAN